MSPDGFSITHDPFDSIEEAQTYIPIYCQRLEHQGYYSAINGRIPLKDLPDYLVIVTSDTLFI